MFRHVPEWCNNYVIKFCQWPAAKKRWPWQYNIIQIYHVWEGYLRKIPVARRKISRSEWRGKFSLKTGIFGRGICEKLKFLLHLQRRVRRWTPCLLSVESREAHVGISLGFPCERWTLLWDLTISGWPNEWINITWQCFIKSDSRHLYEYIIFGFIAPKHFRIIWFSNLSRLSVSDEGYCRSLFVLLVIVLSVLQFTDSDYPLVPSNTSYSRNASCALN